MAYLLYKERLILKRPRCWIHDDHEGTLSVILGESERTPKGPRSVHRTTLGGFPDCCLRDARLRKVALATVRRRCLRFVGEEEAARLASQAEERIRVFLQEVGR